MASLLVFTVLKKLGFKMEFHRQNHRSSAVHRAVVLRCHRSAGRTDSVAGVGIAAVVVGLAVAAAGSAAQVAEVGNRPAAAHRSGYPASAGR